MVGHWSLSIITTYEKNRNFLLVTEVTSDQGMNIGGVRNLNGRKIESLNPALPTSTNRQFP
jgi:hypothetical protein